MLISPRLPRRIGRDVARPLTLAPLMLACAAIGGITVAQTVTGALTPNLALPFLLLPLLIGLPVLLWTVPRSGPLLLLVGALTIEHHPSFIAGQPGAFTSKLPLFRAMGGSIALPVEILEVVIAVVWVLKAAAVRQIHLPSSPLVRAIAAFWALLLLGFGVGMWRGAAFNFALWELRPWMLLTAAYFLTTGLVSSKRALRSVFWALVLATGLKGLHGTFIYLTYARHLKPRPESILGHEESFFFGLFIVVTIALWIYGRRGALRATATVLMPFVVVANLANSRRVAWAILIISLGALLAIAWLTRPDRRRVVGPLFAVLCVFASVYFPLYWNKTDGTLGQPVRAVRSTVSPDERDLSSNRYRDAENENLLENTRRAGPLGKGFGVAIDYDETIADITEFDSMIAYIPHNGLLWIWMRLGIQGEIALWMVIGSAMMGASRLAKVGDDELGMIGAVVVCAVVSWVIIGQQDLGFGAFRIALVMGTLLGCVEAARRLQPAASGPGPEGHVATPS